MQEMEADSLASQALRKRPVLVLWSAFLYFPQCMSVLSTCMGCVCVLETVKLGDGGENGGGEPCSSCKIIPSGMFP